MENIKEKIVQFLRWSQKYTKTDMVYAVSGMFWIFAGKVGLLLVSLAIMTAFSHWVLPEVYGAYQYVVALSVIFSLAALPGINTALVKSIAQGKEGTFKFAIKTKFKWGLLGSLGLLVVSCWYFFNQENILGFAFLITALFLPLKYVADSFLHFWNGRKNFDVRTKYFVSSAILGACVLIPTLYLTDNLLLILFIFFLSHTFFDFIFLRKTYTYIKNDEVDMQTIPFGKNLTLMNSVQIAAQNIDKVILWQFLGPIQVAIYSFAQMPITKIIGTMPLQTLTLPKLGEREINEERKRGLVSKFLKLFIVFVPMAGILALLAPVAYNILFPQYVESVIYFQALTIVVALSPFLLLESALIAELKKKELYIIRITAPAVRILAFLIFTPIYGIWGIIWAIIGTELLKGLVSFYYFQRI